mmetsp:Transcript_13040/g.13975  ORF Transcript_13040/g.13975 Transcript_13040/m.13975 type:complete len:133 (-) Transcript_13040:54-452(-)
MLVTSSYCHRLYNIGIVGKMATHLFFMFVVYVKSRVVDRCPQIKDPCGRDLPIDSLLSTICTVKNKNKSRNTTMLLLRGEREGEEEDRIISDFPLDSHSQGYQQHQHHQQKKRTTTQRDDNDDSENERATQQ